MARQKTVDSEIIIKLLDEYRFENPGIKVSIPKFGSFMRSKGYKIEDYTLRRDNTFRECLKSINSNDENEILNDLVTYKTLDVDAFISKNNSKDKLKEALINRDTYYANVAMRAANAIKAKNVSLAKVQELEYRIAELETLNNELNKKMEEQKNQNDSVELKKKDKAILSLKKILEDYIYPDAANAFLKKEGILEVVNGIIPNEIIEEKTIKADTNIMEDVEKEKGSRFQSVNSLLGGFDE